MSTAIRKNFPYLLTLGIAALIAILFIAGYALAQESEEDEDDGCRWHVENLITDNSLGVTAVQWNDCTGETYQFYRDNDQYQVDTADAVQVRKIR